MINEVSIKSGKKILAVGAHPDDIELGCGGAVAKHIMLGEEVFALILTGGEMGKHTFEDQSECYESFKKLGVKKENIFFAGFPDGKVCDDCRTVDLIENYIKRLNINRVYTHYFNDRHQDHRNCSYAVSSAARRDVSEIFLFQGPSSKVTFEPHYIVELTDAEIEKKTEALNCYKSQISKGIVNVEWIKNLARVHGLSHHVDYAEAFEINHVLRGKNEV